MCVQQCGAGEGEVLASGPPRFMDGKRAVSYRLQRRTWPACHRPRRAAECELPEQRAADERARCALIGARVVGRCAVRRSRGRIHAVLGAARRCRRYLLWSDADLVSYLIAPRGEHAWKL